LSDFEYYKLIRNAIQLRDVSLIELSCIKNEETEDGKEFSINLNVSEKVTILNEQQVYIYLKIEVNFNEEDGPFSIIVVHRGLCHALEELSEDKFTEYATHQVVPLLLPYARECVANSLVRMGLPIYTIPTVDVLGSLDAQMGDKE
jgi:preprotein translocase subunit SecB